MTESVRLWTAVRERRGRVYEALADYREVVGLVDGLLELQPLSEIEGEGSQFAAVLQLGTQRVHSKLVLSRLVPDELVVWSSADADGRELSFRLVPAEDADHTKILLVVVYELPAGIRGVVAAPIVEQAVKRHARATLVRLKEHFGAA